MYDSWKLSNVKIIKWTISAQRTSAWDSFVPSSSRFPAWTHTWRCSGLSPPEWGRYPPLCSRWMLALPTDPVDDNMPSIGRQLNSILKLIPLGLKCSVHLYWELSDVLLTSTGITKFDRSGFSISFKENDLTDLPDPKSTQWWTQAVT